MGRRRNSSVAKTVVSSVDSSPFSAESSFRELDDVFLQTQTRIWLGEVLKIRLDEQLNLSDLLADGVLLFEVSKMVWDMLLEKCVELRHIKAYQCPLGSRKSRGRYMPYSNVDSFLKVCKILGLNGIDLFSPSDVVEKRDVRKVCICIRALSRKARSKQLNVPDFDLVTYTVVMPTDMVGCIRRSLESSQSSISSSSSCNSYKGKRSKSQQKNLSSACSGSYDSCSEESDEAESAYFGIESYSSSADKFDYPATLNSDNENSPGAFSAVKNYSSRPAALRSDMRKLGGNFLAKHCSLHHSRDDHQPDHLSRCHFRAREDLNHGALHTDNDLRCSYKNASEVADIDLALGNDVSNIENSLSENIAERDFIADYLAFSDSVVLRNDGNSPVLFDEEDNLCNFFMGIDYHGGDSKKKTFHNGFHPRSSDDMEDVEVSSVSSMSSILGRVLNMDLDDQYNAGDSSVVQFHFLENDNQGKSSLMEDQTQDSAQCETLSNCSGTDIKESQCEMKLENEGLSTNFLLAYKYNGQSCIMESENFDLSGNSQIHQGNLLPVKSDLDPAEGDENFRNRDLEKSVKDVSELNPDMEEHCNNHSPLGSLHHKIFREEQASCKKSLLEGDTSHFCNLQHEDVVIEVVTSRGSDKQMESVLVDDGFASVQIEYEPMAGKNPSSSARNSRDIDGAGYQASAADYGSIQHNPEDGNKDGRYHNSRGNSAESVLGEKQLPRVDSRDDKIPKRSLLKTVATGTTLAGVLLLLLHLRRRGKRESDDHPQKPLKTPRFVGVKSSPKKEQSSRGVYPSEKLKFAN